MQWLEYIPIFGNTKSYSFTSNDEGEYISRFPLPFPDTYLVVEIICSVSADKLVVDWDYSKPKEDGWGDNVIKFPGSKDG